MPLIQQTFFLNRKKMIEDKTSTPESLFQKNLLKSMRIKRNPISSCDIVYRQHTHLISISKLYHNKLHISIYYATLIKEDFSVYKTTKRMKSMNRMFCFFIDIHISNICFKWLTILKNKLFQFFFRNKTI